MRMGEGPATQFAVGRPGKTSLTFESTARGAADGLVRATARHVHACIDMATFTPLPVPDRLRGALSAHQVLGDTPA